MELRSYVYTRKQLSQSLDNRDITYVYAPLNLIDESLLKYSDRIIIVPPEYLADCESRVKNRLNELKEAGFYKALAHTVGHIELLNYCGYEIYGGHRLNCTNSETLKYLDELCIKDVILSPELTAARINKMKKTVKTGFIAYGKLPLMINRRCPIKNGKPCGKECCGKQITDRMGNKLDVICSENMVEILNSDTLYLSDRLDSFDVDFAVLKFTTENDTDSIVRLYKNGEKANVNRLTRGLYFRGVE